MIGLVMCGGKGSRMRSAEEKLLLKYKKPVIEHVINAMQESRMFSEIICVTSPNAPKTAEFVKSLRISTIKTSGVGYVEDLNQALKNFEDEVFVVSGDLPLLDSHIVRRIVKEFEQGEPWTSILVTRKFLDLHGIKPEFIVDYGGQECAFTGISIVDPRRISGMESVKESYILLEDKRVALNLNTERDYSLLGTT